MFLKGEEFQCRKCGTTQTPRGDIISKPNQPLKEKKEAIVLEGEEMSTLPIAKVECPSCHEHEAYWVLKQTRASDEPETRIYTCKFCKHKWREY
jgi:DNA-directed RNA polymerase subunit M